MNQLKNLAKTTQLQARQVVATAIAGVSNATAATIAGPRHLTQMVNRARQDKNAPRNPKNLHALYFGVQHSKTAKGKDFILYDSGCEEEDGTERTIIFGTKENVDFLAQCTHWFVDGTFKVTPNFFSQLYTIHGK